MRVISGTARGRKLSSPKDLSVRPTTDRIKETLFNIINPRIYGCIFVDIFSGSGAMGIEALSRGANEVYFIDSSRESIKLIQDNLRNTGLEGEKAKVIRADFTRGIRSLSIGKVKADIIFLDPPYDIENIEKIINAIFENNILAKNGIILLEHDKNRNFLSENMEFEIFDSRKYGITAVTFFRNR
ncbi:MAG: 16S rRNA (guanine(966)-N(2))-methyltransferase RsmD [Eubacteriaceae bacterium]|nr:16S rRNA (guanine(966)-N(2))-methyltransferase RsmD [Eubacteriaceae bacterium]